MKHLTRTTSLKLTQDEFNKLAFLKAKKVTINKMFRKLINDQYEVHSEETKVTKVTLNDLIESLTL